jgi:transposase-like protein
MYPLMAAYAASGQTQAAFCAAEGLKVATFQYWWRRYRADQIQAEGGGFVALEPQGTTPAESGIELHYGAVRLRLEGVPAGYVAELVRNLSERC